MEILALGGLIVAVAMVFAVFGLAMLLVKGIVLLILLPLRLVFGILTLPFHLAGGVVAASRLQVVKLVNWGRSADVRRQYGESGLPRAYICVAMRHCGVEFES